MHDVLFGRVCLLAAIASGVCLPAAFAQSAAAPSWEEKRLQRMKLDQIAVALGAREGHRVADLGAGEGVFTAALAKVVGPQGKVYAVDIADEALKRLETRKREKNLDNVEVIRGAEDDPKLPAETLDSVLLMDTYHWLKRQPEVIRHVLESMKPGGRLVIVDYMPNRTRLRPRADQVKNHVVAPEIVEAELKQAGFTMVERRDGFIDNPDEESAFWMIVAEKAAAATR